MVYECENCENVLWPGLTACPNCGEGFDEPVPADATPTEDEEFPAPSSCPDPYPVPPVRRSRRFSRLTAALTAALALAGIGWVGIRVLTPSAPPAAPAETNPFTNTLPTDLKAHPAYVAAMTAFVRQLRASGVDAQWPAFGHNDTLLVTPPTTVNGQKADWTADLCKQLAQGIYANFWEKRYGAGFSDTDSTTCFVLVGDPSGKIVAVDLMGNVE